MNEILAIVAFLILAGLLVSRIERDRPGKVHADSPAHPQAESRDLVPALIPNPLQVRAAPADVRQDLTDTEALPS